MSLTENFPKTVDTVNEMVHNFGPEIFGGTLGFSFDNLDLANVSGIEHQTVDGGSEWFRRYQALRGTDAIERRTSFHCCVHYGRHHFRRHIGRQQQGYSHWAQSDAVSLSMSVL